MALSPRLAVASQNFNTNASFLKQGLAGLSEADWLASEISGSAVVTSRTGAGLLKLAGVDPAASPEGEAKLALTLTGSLKAGLLTVQLAEKIVQRLWDDIEADPSTEVTVDLTERDVRWSGESHGRLSAVCAETGEVVRLP